MSTDTQYLSLTLVNGGDNVGTWGPILNKNFLTIDDLAGEVIEARGDSGNISDRFDEITSELSVARGTTPTLNDRISHLLNPDGTARAQNLPRAGVSTFGAVYVSTAPSQSDVPVALGVNDPRVLTNVEKSELTDGSVTSLHMHNMSSISDVTATASEISVALSGISQNVTSNNLNTLTSGGVVPKSLMTIPNAAKGYTGIVSLSVEPVSGSPIALAENDNRVLTDVQKNELVSKANTSLHKHKLADGASDLTVTAAELNRFAGSPSTVTSSNLGALTSGGSTGLHNHNNTYYLKSEVDTKDLDVQNKATTYVSNHNTSNDSHSGADLSLGRITAKTIRLDTKDSVVDVKAVSDDTSAIKILVRDSSGLPVITMSSDGTISTKKIISEEHQVTKTTTLSQDAVLTSNLTVKGNTILGDSETTDTVTVNAQSTQLNSPLSDKGAITTTGTVNGVDITTLGKDSAANKTEITVARATYPTLNDRIMYEVNTLNTSINAVKNNKANPNQVTITQAVAADNGTDITVLELETLTDGSNADALHIHSKYDNIINAGKVSPIYGTFGDMNLRTDNIEQRLNATETEVTNARNGKISVDARLDEIDLQIVDKQVQLTTHTGEIAGINTRIGIEVATLNTKIDANATAIAARATALEQKDVTLTTEITALKAEDVSIKTLVQGNSKALNASSIVARKEVYKDVNISVVGSVVGENIQSTGYVDQFVSVSVYNKADNALIPSADFEYLKVEMVGAVSTVKFKLKAASSYAVNSNKVNVVIIG